MEDQPMEQKGGQNGLPKIPKLEPNLEPYPQHNGGRRDNRQRERRDDRPRHHQEDDYDPWFIPENSVERLDRPSAYFLSKRRRNPLSGPDPLDTTTTLYVGNLSFYTTEEQIHELFMKVGEIKRLIMGLDRYQKTPCGFCFVEYYTHEAALDCMKYISGTKLDERVIRTDLDPGFEEGRQYGRGKSGGQVRDEYREEFDPGRGGYGKIAEMEREEEEIARGAGGRREQW